MLEELDSDEVDARRFRGPFTILDGVFIAPKKCMNTTN